MTPEQAIDILNQMAAAAPASRSDHAAAVEAVRLLTELVVVPTDG